MSDLAPDRFTRLAWEEPREALLFLDESGLILATNPAAEALLGPSLVGQ